MHVMLCGTITCNYCGGNPSSEGLPYARVQSLTENGLRERVLLRVDGGMRSGRDVLLAAALGGDEFGFGTVAMIATGCIMARVCHTNNCPVGVASQREELRARFPGAPADLVRGPPGYPLWILLSFKGWGLRYPFACWLRLLPTGAWMSLNVLVSAVDTICSRSWPVACAC